MSLHDGLAWDWRVGRIKVADSDRAQHGCGALGVVGDRALAGAVAEIDVDHTRGLEDGQRFGGGKIKVCRLELLFDRLVNEEGKRRDEDVGLYTIVGLVIDRPQVEDVLEVGKRALDFGQFLVRTAWTADRWGSSI